MDPEGDRPRVPSGTSLRFASLTLLVVAATVLIFSQHASVWTTASLLDNARCQVKSGSYLTSRAGVSDWDGYRECMAAFSHGLVLWLAGGLVLLLVVAVPLHALWPIWLRRRRSPASARVTVTSAALALWRAFVIAVLTPYVLMLFHPALWPITTRRHVIALVLLVGTATLVRTRWRGHVRSRAIWAAAIAVLGVAAALWWPPAPQNTAINTDKAVRTWIDGGGWDRVTTVVRASEQVFTGVRAADPAAIAAGCEALGPVLREPFPAPPDVQIATMWAEGVRALENGTRSCLVVFRDSGPDDGSMTSEFLKGLDQLEVTQTALIEAQRRALS